MTVYCCVEFRSSGYFFSSQCQVLKSILCISYKTQYLCSGSVGERQSSGYKVKGFHLVKKEKVLVKTSSNDLALQKTYLMLVSCISLIVSEL